MTHRTTFHSLTSQPALWLNVLTLTIALAVTCAWLVSGLLGWDSLAWRSVLLTMLLGIAAVAGVSLYKLTSQRRHAALRTIKRFSQTNFAELGDSDPLDVLLDDGLSPQWASALRPLAGQLHDQATRLADTEQSRARAEVKAKRLEREHTTIRLILDHLEEPVLAIDGYQELSYANQAAGKLFGFSPGAADTGPLETLAECAQLVDLLLETSRHRAVTRRSAEIQWGGDWYRIRTNSLGEGDQSGSGAVAVLREINEQKTMQRRNAEFVSAVSHEMKTPLTGIKAYVELLADGDAEDEQTREEFLGVINGQADRLQRLIDNLLNLARIEAGVVEVSKEELSLNEVLEGALEVVAPAAERKSIQLVNELSPMFLGVLADRDMIAQAAINLLSNAIKYTPDGGRVTLRSQLIGSDVAFSVEDTGVGLSEEDCGRVFDKFYRVKKDKQMAAGTGLGLPLAKHIVEDVHGGRLEVESQIGLGSTFKITLTEQTRVPAMA